MKTFCGPKFSLCCTILSIWGIIQLLIMAVFFWIRSPAFIEDLSIPGSAEENASKYVVAIDESYHQIAVNCAVASAMYVVTLVVSGWQMWLNSKS